MFMLKLSLLVNEKEMSYDIVQIIYFAWSMDNNVR